MVVLIFTRCYSVLNLMAMVCLKNLSVTKCSNVDRTVELIIIPFQNPAFDSRISSLTVKEWAASRINNPIPYNFHWTGGACCNNPSCTKFRH